MHSILERLENNKDLIDLLKNCKCSDEMINSLLKSEHFDLLVDRIKEHTKLFTALLENEYDGKAIEHIFSHEHFSSMLNRKETAISLVENKFDYRIIPLISKYGYKNNVNKYINHKGVFDLLVKNGLTDAQTICLMLINIKNCEDEVIKISNNKELFMFFTAAGLIQFCNKQEVDESVRLKNNHVYSDNPEPYVLYNKMIIRKSDKWFNKIIKTQSLVCNALETNQFMFSDLEHSPFFCDSYLGKHRECFFTGTDEDIKRIAESKLAINKLEEIKSQDHSMTTAVKVFINTIESKQNERVSPLVTLSAISLPIVENASVACNR